LFRYALFPVAAVCALPLVVLALLLTFTVNCVRGVFAQTPLGDICDGLDPLAGPSPLEADSKHEALARDGKKGEFSSLLSPRPTAKVGINDMWREVLRLLDEHCPFSRVDVWVPTFAGNSHGGIIGRNRLHTPGKDVVRFIATQVMLPAV
jgi:hypothetical protein